MLVIIRFLFEEPDSGCQDLDIKVIGEDDKNKKKEVFIAEDEE